MGLFRGCKQISVWCRSFSYFLYICIFAGWDKYIVMLNSPELRVSFVMPNTRRWSALSPGGYSVLLHLPNVKHPHAWRYFTVCQSRCVPSPKITHNLSPLSCTWFHHLTLLMSTLLENIFLDLKLTSTRPYHVVYSSSCFFLSVM